MTRRGRASSCRSDVDLLVIYVTTYAQSSTVLPMVQRAKVPVLVLNLQPQAAIDYEMLNQLPDRTSMTGEWLAYCSSCPMPEISNVLSRAQIPFHQVTGVLGEDGVRGEIGGMDRSSPDQEAILPRIALGLLGHYYSGMLGHHDGCRTQVAITFGCHVEHLEVDAVNRIARSGERGRCPSAHSRLSDPLRCATGLLRMR